MLGICLCFESDLFEVWSPRGWKGVGAGFPVGGSWGQYCRIGMKFARSL